MLPKITGKITIPAVVTLRFLEHRGKIDRHGLLKKFCFRRFVRFAECAITKRGELDELNALPQNKLFSPSALNRQ